MDEDVVDPPTAGGPVADLSADDASIGVVPVGMRRPHPSEGADSELGQGRDQRYLKDHRGLCYRTRQNGWPAGSAKTLKRSPPAVRRDAPSSSALASPVSRSSTRRSRWACCGYAGSGQRGGLYSPTCWNITFLPSPETSAPSGPS